MKQKFITLAEAIANGLLRIFPRPATIVALFILALLFIGCGAQKTVTQLVENVRTDTIYITSQQYDSIYIYQERNVLPLSDSLHLPFNGEDGRGLYIKEKSIEYRYKLLRDTVKVTQRDSIPYEVTITEVKEITRPLTWFDHLTRLVFWFVLGYLISIIFFKLKSKIY